MHRNPTPELSKSELSLLKSIHKISRRCRLGPRPDGEIDPEAMCETIKRCLVDAVFRPKSAQAEIGLRLIEAASAQPTAA